ncbi:MAG: dienelactone hydrolase family protein [Deltaproteobacteria bacterium]|nr:dienelactone hydrolase family protein [Deltaproteobacteria bacterium]
MPSTSVTFSSDPGPAEGLLVKPARSTCGIVLVQEWWGLVPHIEDVARRFAALGYTVLAPDLYRGTKTLDAEEASHLMNDLDFGRAAREIAGAVNHLRTVEGCERVAVLGFCMGGALATIAASLGVVDAYVAFYGFAPKGAADLDAIRAPGLFFFGEHEGFFSVPDARAFAGKQTARGIPTTVHVYPGAGHAFFNDTRPEVYDAVAAKDAFARTLAHLAEHLQGVGAFATRG